MLARVGGRIKAWEDCMRVFTGPSVGEWGRSRWLARRRLSSCEQAQALIEDIRQSISSSVTSSKADTSP